MKTITGCVYSNNLLGVDAAVGSVYWRRGDRTKGCMTTWFKLTCEQRFRFFVLPNQRTNVLQGSSVNMHMKWKDERNVVMATTGYALGGRNNAVRVNCGVAVTGYIPGWCDMAMMCNNIVSYMKQNKQWRLCI